MSNYPKHSMLNDTTIIPGIPGYNDGSTSISNSQLNWYEYAIKGRMLTASLELSESQLARSPKDEIKKSLAMQLAEGMLEEGCIEYTQSRDIYYHAVTIRARAFVVPSDMVQILRTLKK